ncbi:DMT family transporter [Hominifimenecus sp. rT4P-3]|uniref:DMT family transporter n=1 Tax=Hominifimenecus sp. rT4P-3 TaxID=3242979 RepID=UPI003DA34479
MWGILISMLSGALMSIQGVFNTGVTEKTSVWVAAGWVQLTAFLACVVAWFFTGRPSVTAIAGVHPRYLLLGGIFGAAITYTVIQGMEALGPAKAVLLIVVAQLAVAYLIELFGLFGSDKVEFQFHKLIGLVIAVVGIVIFQK